MPLFADRSPAFSAQPQRPLRLCGKTRARITAETPRTLRLRREVSNALLWLLKLSHDSSTEDLNVHDIKQG